MATRPEDGTRKWPSTFSTERNGIYIIDLQKTVKKLEEGVISSSGIRRPPAVPFCCVGTKKQAQDAIREEAERAGMFYVNARWLGGMLTNFQTMRGRIDRLNQLKKMQEDGTFDLLPKKEVIKLQLEIAKLEKYLGGVKNMKKLPRRAVHRRPAQGEERHCRGQKAGHPGGGHCRYQLRSR